MIDRAAFRKHRRYAQTAGLVEVGVELHDLRELDLQAERAQWSYAVGVAVWLAIGVIALAASAHAGYPPWTFALVGGCVLAAVRDADHVFRDQELYLEPGDAVVLYTDGVTEAMNAQGQFFAQGSLEPVQQLVELYGHLSAKKLLEAVLWELKQFIGDAEQADDITVVTIKRRG